MTKAPASITAAALPTTTSKANSVVTAQGAVIASTQTLNGHTWVAGSDGLYHTGDLSAEWLTLYNEAKAGTKLTTAQMLEANAEAVFLNSAIAGWENSPGGAARAQSAREDVQRVIDALAQAETLDAVAAGTPFTVNLVEVIDKTIATNPVLNEFVAQGYGAPGAAQGSRYSGMQGDVYGADWSTRYVGSGFGHGDGATREFLRDAVLGDIGMPVFVSWNGVLSAETTSSWESLALSQAAAQLNLYGNSKVLTQTDFS